MECFRKNAIQLALQLIPRAMTLVLPVYKASNQLNS